MNCTLSHLSNVYYIYFFYIDNMHLVLISRTPHLMPEAPQAFAPLASNNFGPCHYYHGWTFLVPPYHPTSIEGQTIPRGHSSLQLELQKELERINVTPLSQFVCPLRGIHLFKESKILPFKSFKIPKLPFNNLKLLKNKWVKMWKYHINSKVKGKRRSIQHFGFLKWTNILKHHKKEKLTNKLRQRESLFIYL